MSIKSVLSNLQKNLDVPKSRYNKFNDNYYRNAEDILDAVKKIMPDDSYIKLYDDIVNLGDRYYIKATAEFHCGDELISCTAFAREALSKTKMDDSQLTGSASSYARKYALNGLFALDDVRDADSDIPDKQKGETIIKTKFDKTEKMEEIIFRRIINEVKKNTKETLPEYWNSEPAKTDRAKLKSLSTVLYNLVVTERDKVLNDKIPE